MVERFTADWLALREAVDHRSRPEGLLVPLRAWWRARGASHVVDLGSGTGSNLRYLAPRLDPGQRWRLVDHDRELLRRAGAGQVAGAEAVELVAGDLVREGILAARGAELLTASALLDLVSGKWLEELVGACASARAAALLALSWDGAIEWGGASDPDDALVAEAVRAHQRLDKGLGPALGATAAAAAERAFAAAGYHTELAPSPWVLGLEGPGERALGVELIDGWARAAAEQRPEHATRLRAWGERRMAAVSGGPCALIVGHLDLLALPPA